MFEVLITKKDGSHESYDALNEIQAECIFFRARMKPETEQVELNEVIDLEELVNK